jgi:triacylglycerol lipase
LAPYLLSQGYCVYALNYGNNATGDINASAHELSDFVDFVLAQTGATKVDMVGHSQGGLMPRDYINNFDGASKVDKLIGLSPSNHGTTNPLAPYGGTCVACTQQVYESDFIKSVNGSGETRAGIYYTVIETKYDEVVTPYTSAFLNGGLNNPQVTNVLLQNDCPADVDDHIGTAYDPLVFQIVNNALSQGAAPGDPHFDPCAQPALTQSGGGSSRKASTVASHPLPFASTSPPAQQTAAAAEPPPGEGVAPPANAVLGTPNFTG